ncbi:peroxiredoxin [Methylocystis echinoides]|uniref:peroxiredoxin n=1 Tax=Methylocystis echinoides TaxID=29468 RepID=UPI003417491E
MIKPIIASLAFALLMSPAQAALKTGDRAPDFTAPAAIGGKDFSFSLAEALKKGPVVLYFYPKSFTRGCTIEAHEFAENFDNFTAAGASLVGVSGDPIEVQREFSTKECRDKFPVAADPSFNVINAYDAKRLKPSATGDTVADRISYIILPNGNIGFSLIDSNPSRHVEATLEFVRKWREDNKR